MRENSIAMRGVIRELTDDPEMWEGWKVNIAMAFVDEYLRVECRRGYVPYERQAEIRQMGLIAAEVFLRWLCRDPVKVVGQESSVDVKLREQAAEAKKEVEESQAPWMEVCKNCGHRRLHHKYAGRCSDQKTGMGDTCECPWFNAPEVDRRLAGLTI